MNKVLFGMGLTLGIVVYGKITYYIGYTKGWVKGKEPEAE